MADKQTEKFVNYVFETIHIKKNTGFAARLKRADNEATEYQSWDILAKWVDLEWLEKRKAYALVGASIARTKLKTDGTFGLGKALRKTVEDFKTIEKSSTSSRIRRLLSCHDSGELLGILRSNLRFLETKEVSISYSTLLEEILWFNREESKDRTRAKWAADFYGRLEEEE